MSVPGYDTDLAYLKITTTAQTAQAFGPGTTANHMHRVDSFIRFYDNYKLDFINLSPSTLFYYITHHHIHIINKCEELCL